MEGVAYLLRKNCKQIQSKGTKLTRILATGGGAQSPVWCMLYADITHLTVEIPAEKEAVVLALP